MVEVGVQSVTLVGETKELAGDCAERSAPFGLRRELSRTLSAHGRSAKLSRAAKPWAIATRTHSILIIYEF
jgi:hypothetical protein